jgi:hypothetical protein
MRDVKLVCEPSPKGKSGLSFSFPKKKRPLDPNGKAIVASVMGSVRQYCDAFEIELECLDPGETAAQGARFSTARLAVALAAADVHHYGGYELTISGVSIPKALQRAALLLFAEQELYLRELVAIRNDDDQDDDVNDDDDVTDDDDGDC